MILFRKLNDVYLNFEGDKADLQTLSDYFTFKVPGANFTPAYRNKYWDGKIRLANLKDSTIYAGLVHVLNERELVMTCSNYHVCMQG